MTNSYARSGMQRLLMLLSFSAIVLSPAFAQLTVSPISGPAGTHAQQLAQNLVGTGVLVTNAVLTGRGANAVGFYNGTGSNIGLSQGILLTTGKIDNAVGPNNNGSSTYVNNGPTILLLNALISPQSTVDGTMLEFDVKVDSSGLLFEYVFASEEYLEFACSNYNDVFGFFISGPGVAGNVPGFPGVRNIALIPNTTTPVSINSVHGHYNNGCPATNAQYYVNNGTGTTPTVNTSVQYDGFTTVLTAQIFGLVPNETYHLRLAIADVGDSSYDSAVFFEHSSLRSCATPNCNPTAVAPALASSGIRTRFYPNPVSDEAHLVVSGLPMDVSVLEVRVTDLLGRQVTGHRQGGANAAGEVALTFGTGNLEAGLYLYSVLLGEQQIASGRFVVNR